MKTTERVFSRYQVFIIAMLALLQFTVVLDFMVLSPLGEILLGKLHITTRQFGLVVSAYAFSAGISGVLAAGFADKFDRKKMLLVFYTGFVTGTFLCALAPNYEFLLAARVITGLFGGVISAIGMAIIADLFRPEVRGRVMGFVQMAFALSQIIGVPMGWELANRIHWHAPFWMIGAFGTIMGIVMAVYMKPVTAHLQQKVEKNAFAHLKHTLQNKHYSLAFCTTILLSTGGFMLMPFGSTFSRHNMGLAQSDITLLYIATGIATFIGAPILGRLSDKLGKMKVFLGATLLTSVMVVIFTNLGITPLYMAITINALMMIGVFGRIIPAQAIMTSLPNIQDRGAFMSINASVQQISGGIASIVAGLIVYQTSSGVLLHYEILGYVILGAFAFTAVMMYYLNKQVQRQMAPVVTPDEVAIAS
ncbi:MFS transporter [Chitinophaga alhagiae]|uniref:MFS transporter n=1 Tax=Chitinophaga alhagiae TaxID=2203219 RepID=UPI000E5A9894|nr:MFS transporter [Chitinophaga alhagiae]